MEVIDSRRLTGPGLIWEHPGAVIDVRLDQGEAEILLPAWQHNARDMLDRLGLNGESLTVRRYPDGASVAMSAPLDMLYAATAINDWAWAAAAGRTEGGDPPDDTETAFARLRADIAQERNPRLLALISRASARNIPFLVDDEKLSLGLGKHGMTWTVDRLPDPDGVDWSGLGSVPLALVTGTNGKTTSVRLLTRIAQLAGHSPGVSSTDWIAIGDQIIERGDWSGPGGARAVLRDPRVSIGILETARGGLLRRGLAINRADAVLITNVAADHLGEFGVTDIGQLADVKWIVTRALGDGGRAVLNARDSLLVERGLAARFPITWFSLDPGLPLVRESIAKGGRVVTLESDELVLFQNRSRSVITSTQNVPITLGGTALHNIDNALGVIGLANALGFSNSQIAQGLETTQVDDNPGRCNLFSIGGADVLVDFAHNPHGIEAILELARRRPAKRRLLLIGQAGDRSDEAIRELAQKAWTIGLDHVVIKEMPDYARGREPTGVAKIIREAMIEAGASTSAMSQFVSEQEGVEFALDWAQPGDLLILFVHAHVGDILSLLRERAAA